MKKIVLALLVLLAGTLSLQAQKNTEKRTEKLLAAKGLFITYPGWRLKALSFSYDDGNIADRRLIGIFNKYGLKGTFHIPSAWLKTKPKNRVKEEEITRLYAGHEISGHGANHLNMAKLTPQKIAGELDEEIREWKRITGKKVTGYAYPYGRFSPAVIEALRKRGYLYARPIKKNNSFDLPEDLMHWTPQGHHNSRIQNWGKRYLASKPQTLSVLLIWGHSYEFPRKNNWQVMEEFCHLMSGKKEIFYATMEEIARYVTDVRSLQLSPDGKTIKNVSSRSIYFIHKGKKRLLEPGKSFSF